MTNCTMCTKFGECPWQTNPNSYCSAYEQRAMTNADRIRSMSDEELADLIANACDYICKGTSCPLIRQNGITCEDRVLEWLRQECER